MSGRKIMIPVDTSKHSKRALEWYIENIHHVGDHLYLFHSIEMPSFPYAAGAGGGPYPVDEWREEVNRKFKAVGELRKEYEEILAKNNVTGEIIADQPAKKYVGDHIVEAAKERHVDFIVVGSRGQGLVRRTVLGSVSDYILHHTHIPVTIVPPL